MKYEIAEAAEDKSGQCGYLRRSSYGRTLISIVSVVICVVGNLVHLIS